MELTPLYELRDRLRAGIIAGAALAAEDFRLSRALENFSTLEKASPVFAKLGQLGRSALAPDCPDRAGALYRDRGPKLGGGGRLPAGGGAMTCFCRRRIRFPAAGTGHRL